jgi:hypothetical protein
VKRQDVIRELITIGIPPWPNVGFQMAKKILHLSEKPPGTFQRIGARFKRDMSQEEAARLVNAAKQRIELVDEGG